MKTVAVNSMSPADQLVSAGDGPTMLTNTDINNTVYISENVGLLPSDVARSVFISPQSTLVVDGSTDVYAITATGLTAAVFVVPGGISYFQSGITGSGFQANQYGAFFYSGIPAHGNLIEAITSVNAPGQDTYGNPYTPGGESLFAQGKILIYAASPPALHNLLVALTGNNGGDLVGNTWAPGVTVYENPATGYPVGITIASNNTHETEAGYLAGGVNSPGGGTNEKPYLELVAPQWSGAKDYTTLAVLGPNYNSPATSQGTLSYVDSGGSTNHSELIWGQGGCYIALCNGIYAVKPGTADTTLAQETWHSITLSSGWTPAGSGLNYRMLPDGNVQIVGIATHASFTSEIALAAAGAIPSAYQPAETYYLPVALTTDASVAVTSGGGLNAYPPTAGATAVRLSCIYPLGI